MGFSVIRTWAADGPTAELSGKPGDGLTRQYQGLRRRDMWKKKALNGVYEMVRAIQIM